MLLASHAGRRRPERARPSPRRRCALASASTRRPEDLAAGDPGRPARPRPVRRPRRPGRPGQRRRPAQPGQGAAPQDRLRPRHRHPAAAHPRQPRPAAADLRDQARSASRWPAARPRAATVLAIGDVPRLAARHADPGAGLRPRRRSGSPAELRHQAELSGATVVDRASVITTHLAEVVSQHAARLLGREDVRLLTDVVKRTHPVVVEELTPAQLSLGEVQRVLQALLDEGVSIRDLVRIFEALSLRAAGTKDLDAPRRVAPGRRSGPAIVAPHTTRRHRARDQPRPAARAADARGRCGRPRRGTIIALDPETGQSVLTQLDAAGPRGARTATSPPGPGLRPADPRRRTPPPAARPCRGWRCSPTPS